MDELSQIQLFNKVGNNIAKEVAQYSPQLYSVKNHNNRLPPVADSSSVLLTVKERFFLITAGHVIHNQDLNNLGVMIENDFCTIGGIVKYFEPNDLNDCDPNKLDIAIFELDTETVNMVTEKYKFLSWNKVGLNHSSSQSSRYLIFGYPGKKTQLHYPSKEIKPTPLVLRTVGVSINYYANENVNYYRTIILTVDQKKVARSSTTELEQLPMLGGISGCGVWDVVNLSADNPQYQLVSILTGENADQTVLYSSRTDNVKNILEREFNIGSLLDKI